MAVIYKITNNITGKVYIGFTKQPVDKRLATHFYNSVRFNGCYNSKLYNSIRKHGKSAFTIEEIYYANDDEYLLRIMEAYFIKEFDSYNTGYNSTLGGEGNIGLVVSNETRKKQSLAKQGKVTWWIGRKHSEESKEKMRTSALNRRKI